MRMYEAFCQAADGSSRTSFRVSHFFLVASVCLVLAWSFGRPVAAQSALASGNAPAELREAGSHVAPVPSPNLPDDPPPPLPADCISLALPGEEPPSSCVYGYVYFDGSPVAGASVTIQSEPAVLNLTTQSGPDSPEPYFAAALSDPPLNVSVGDIVVAEATYDSQTNSTTFTAVEDGQQVDVYLSSICGPTLIPGGPVGVSTTWYRACSPYVVTGSVLVEEAVLLNIEPGTTVKFDADKALTVDGYLTASGTSNAMIVFTSNASISPAPGDWDYIQLRDQAVDLAPSDLITNTIRYALIEYAGGADVEDNAAVRVNGDSPWVTYSTIRHSASDGIRAFNDGAPVLSVDTIIDNAGWGVWVGNDAAPVTPTVAYSTIAGNGGGGVYVAGSRAALITFNTISGNQGGSGVWVYEIETAADIAGNTITENSALAVYPRYGGGIHLQDATSYINHNVIAGNSAEHGGGITCMHRSSGTVINDNIILGNTAKNNGGGIYFNGILAYINLNVIAENQAGIQGGGIFLPRFATMGYIHANAILANESVAHGGGICAKVSELSIKWNTILGNQSGESSDGVYIDEYPVFALNNLYGNADYDLYNANPEGSPNLDARENWWRAYEAPAIRERIFDYYDDAALGVVDIYPWRLSYSLEAPISPPTGLTATPSGDTISLQWQPNGENDLLGYRVYYDREAPGFPYGGTGANEGDSPIDVETATTFTLTDLPSGRYYLSVTAYDNDVDGDDDQTEGHESWFAEEVTVLVGDETPQADFYGAPTIGVVPLTVVFADTSTGVIDAWLWAFGDGVTSTLDSPTHIYQIADVYTVTLEVSGPGGRDTETKSAYITVREEYSVYMPLILRQSH